MKEFTFHMPGKICYGTGRSQELPRMCRQLGGTKVFLVTGNHIAASQVFLDMEKAFDEEKLPYTVYRNTVSEPTVEAVEHMSEVMRQSGCDLVAAVGGGSVIDLAKAANLLQKNPGHLREYLFGGTKAVEAPGFPLICVPSTAGSGSEVTGAAVVEDSERSIKLSVTSPYLIPKAVIADPRLHAGMPEKVTAGTGLDALTHAIEAYTSIKANPFSDMYAREAISLIGKNLEAAYFEPENLEARGKMALASMMAAAAFLHSGLGAVHGISQAVGGLAHVPHGIANALLLPAVMEQNQEGNPEKFAEIGRLLGSTSRGNHAAEYGNGQIRTWQRVFKLPRGLFQAGVRQEMIPAIVQETMNYRLLSCNPVPCTREMIEEILRECW